MNIVHVVESLEIGGLEHVVLSLAKAQKQQGHTVRIVCLWRLGALARQALDADIEVVCIDKRPGLDIGAVLRLRKLLGRARAPVLHTHNAMAHYYGVAASLGLAIPCVVNTRHGMGSTRLTARTERLYRLALRASHAAVCVCEAARERFVSQGVMPVAKAVVIRNGIDLSRFSARNEAAAARLRTELALPARAVVFGTVGRLNEAKQQSLMLQAVRRLRDGGQAAVLVLVGDGALRSALEDERDRLGLQDSVRLLGSRDDVPDLLAGMDAFVLASRTEGYSLALVEASAAALPIIATDVGGNAEIVEHGVTGLVVPSGDVGQLAAAMSSLARYPDRRAALGRQARDWALREGTLKAMTERHAALYGRHLAARGATAGATTAEDLVNGGP